MIRVLEAAVAQTANPWPMRRERAAELAEHFPHAAEMLRLYTALTIVQENARQETRSRDIAEFAARNLLPAIVDVTVEAGPRPLRDGVIAVFCSADLVNLVQRWLDGQPLTPVETYLARASASPLLEVLMTPHPDPPPQGGREKSPPPHQGGREFSPMLHPAQP